MPHLKKPLHKTIPRVALIIETASAYGRRILEGVALYNRENDPWVVYAAPRALHDAVRPWILCGQVDGIICRVDEEENARILADTGLPIVNLIATTQTCLGPVRVVSDHGAIGEMAAKHLFDCGFRNFAFFGIPGVGWSDLRWKGFTASVREMGCRSSQYAWRCSAFTTWLDGDMVDDVDAITRWIARCPKPLGVMAANDFIGVQISNACRNADISIPYEVAVLGVDNDLSICDLGLPPLSSIEPDCRRLGYEAAKLLDGLMRGKNMPDTPILIPPREIIVRGSTQVAAVNDPLVSRCMAYIREHACDGINVSDVLDFAMVSRTSLQDRFRLALNTTVHRSIMQIRMERTQQLLVQTDLPLKCIADRVGFSHPEHLHEVFRRHQHMTPGQYRKKFTADGV